MCDADQTDSSQSACKNQEFLLQGGVESIVPISVGRQSALPGLPLNFIRESIS